MATKAERFRYWTERSGPKKPKSQPRPRRDIPIDTAQPGVSASDRKSAPRKPSPKMAKKATYAFEAAQGARPSRRSTRKAANRQRTDAKMRVKTRTAALEPRPL